MKHNAEVDPVCLHSFVISVSVQCECEGYARLCEKKKQRLRTFRYEVKLSFIFAA
jgi:hypothetical protein